MKKLEVIKVGGAVVEDPVALGLFLDAIAANPHDKVLVHGGGRTATDVAAKLGIETRMVAGRRITDADMLSVVTMVYGGLVNKNVVASLQAEGVNAIGLTGADMCCMLAGKRPVKDIDYGFVGDMKKVDGQAIARLVEAGFTPVMAPLTYDGMGGLLNTNADTIASEVAKALAPLYDVTLNFYFEKSGVLLDPSDESSKLDSIDRAQFNRLVAEGVIAGGMIPKLQNAFAALENGVGKVCISGTKVTL